ncbi:protein MAINTENANCE OF MERISTEMS-like [Gossypium raimondii]|uniref:protein MAINTENANCE OF MERISTEMS-like n=1 Tax=Gossypium raimondii TaxID=29730 RepID=UPI00227A3E11|nr:protein MAINTENANCE OF MERISTEMS-like [Gossypium raimondii]
MEESFLPVKVVVDPLEVEVEVEEREIQANETLAIDKGKTIFVKASNHGKSGIAMAGLIRNDEHISDAANNEDSFRVLRGRVSVLKKVPDARLMAYLELAGFGSVALIRSSDLRFDLLSALVERWRPETHTFHFPCGECTVTLEDIALQLGLPIDGSPVTGVSSFTDPAALCYQLLGDSLGDATATECELMCVARAYIMHMLGAVLMPDANGDSVHLMYLPLLADLSTARSYSSGSAVLAMLYQELCRPPRRYTPRTTPSNHQF